MTAAQSYDRLPYHNLAYTLVHPGRVQSVAWQVGVRAPNPTSSRVLELGCAGGWNLFPLASAYPGIELLGMDISPVQVEDGNAAITAAGLDGVEIRCADILEIDASWGQFDYILCHGVYSWVPPAVQDKILTLCRQRLSPSGIALVSYNVHPMWKIRGLVRDLMRYHLSQIDPLPEREALAEGRRIVEKLVGLSVRGHLRDLLHEEVKRVLSRADPYVFHEFLEDHNEALYFHEFAERATTAGLTYVGDATTATRSEPHIPRQVWEMLDPLPVVQREQYLDVLLSTAFRYTLLTHAGAEVARDRNPEAFADGHIRLIARPENREFERGGQAPVEVEVRGRVFTVQSPTARRALTRLVKRWPETVEFAALSDGPGTRAELCRELRAMFDAGAIELFLEPPRISGTISDRPEAGPFARHQAATGETVTGSFHEGSDLDAVARAVLKCLDGTSDHATVVDRVVAAIEAGDVEFAGGAPPRASVERHVNNALGRIRDAAILVR